MKLFFALSLAIFLMGCKTTNSDKNMEANKRELTCKLTSPEMQRRKATVIASLKEQVIEKEELSEGYSYKFKGTDSVVDELATFVKTERLCCDFFDFDLKIAGDASFAWLTFCAERPPVV